ncbi:MAG: hypothetical protein HIU93_14365 [Acidobacteria bacterium]|nr:hypothetical protein [Acidobacteriota bacterium]
MLAQTTLRGTEYVPALNGHGLIALGETSKPLLSYGYQLGAGWDSSNLDGSSALITASPYVTVQSVLAANEFIVQYSPTFTKYSAANYVGGNLQRGSATILGTINPRWRWNAGTTIAYGQDSLQTIAPTQTVVVGDIAAVSPDAAIYLANAGVGTYINVGTGFTYLRSERDAIDVQLGEGYSHFTGINGDTNVASAQVNYVHNVSPTLSVSPYLQILESTGYISCTSVGGGAGLNWQVGERTGIALSAGPQISTKGCGTLVSYVFSAALNTQLSKVSQLYLMAGRQFSSPYLGPGVWENTAGAGYQRMLGSATAATLDLSYAGSTGAGSAYNYSGVFLGATIARTIGRAFSPSISYQRVMGNTGPSPFNLNTVLFSINWTSNTTPLIR